MFSESFYSMSLDDDRISLAQKRQETENKSLEQYKREEQKCLQETVNHPVLTDPKFQSILECTKRLLEKRVKCANNAYSAIYTDRRIEEIVTPEKLAAYPLSPTARRYMEAFKLYYRGWSILHQRYKKQHVETDQDCDLLQTAFHCYALAHMKENSLYDQFRPPENTAKLVDEYLKLRPRDILAEYYKVIIVLKVDPTIFSDDKFSDYELLKTHIITAEEFVFKHSAYVECSAATSRVLTDLYYTLGSIYAITRQERRSLDSFQKCLDLDPTNTSALYGVAFQSMVRDPEKALKLFLSFVEKAPECDKQYPNAFYNIACVFVTHYKNKNEAIRYTKLAEDAEKKRFPFFKPVNSKQKTLMQTLKTLCVQPL